MLFWLKDKVLYAVLASLFQSLHFDLLLCDCTRPLRAVSLRDSSGWTDWNIIHKTRSVVPKSNLADGARTAANQWRRPLCLLYRSVLSKHRWGLITNLINITDFNEVFPFNYTFLTNDSMWACSLIAHSYGMCFQKRLSGVPLLPDLNLAPG